MAAITWSAAWEGTPTATGEAPSGGAVRIQNFKSAVDRRVAHEHGTYSNADVGADGTEANDWWHREGSAVAYYSDTSPSYRPDGTTALGSNDKGRLFVSNSGHYTSYIYTGSAWTSISTYAATAGYCLSAPTIDAGVNAYNLRFKVISIGAWNMKATKSKEVYYGATLSLGKVFGCEAWIQNDARTGRFNFIQVVDQGVGVSQGDYGGYMQLYTTNVALVRISLGFFEATAFDDSTMNRGHVLLTYTAD
ncbi:MAG: hypothetical protein KJ888_21085 [Gammaproteobacteria bacterium]|uniref:Uncharacterized protein n=1 Tax=viral metagenome TaxID=1070528 RepID=A0A6M3LN67_9ZZZZ|nr:hypothetical protein [Gammaproteobacteria bacterium]